MKLCKLLNMKKSHSASMKDIETDGIGKLLNAFETNQKRHEDTFSRIIDKYTNCGASEVIDLNCIDDMKLRKKKLSQTAVSPQVYEKCDLMNSMPVAHLQSRDSTDYGVKLEECSVVLHNLNITLHTEHSETDNFSTVVGSSIQKKTKGKPSPVRNLAPLSSPSNDGTKMRVLPINHSTPLTRKIELRRKVLMDNQTLYSAAANKRGTQRSQSRELSVDTTETREKVIPALVTPHSRTKEQRKELPTDNPAPSSSDTKGELLPINHPTSLVSSRKTEIMRKQSTVSNASGTKRNPSRELSITTNETKEKVIPTDNAVLVTTHSKTEAQEKRLPMDIPVPFSSNIEEELLLPNNTALCSPPSKKGIKRKGSQREDLSQIMSHRKRRGKLLDKLHLLTARRRTDKKKSTHNFIIKGTSNSTETKQKVLPSNNPTPLVHAITHRKSQPVLSSVYPAIFS